jgi:hypothetical protein
MAVVAALTALNEKKMVLATTTTTYPERLKIRLHQPGVLTQSPNKSIHCSYKISSRRRLITRYVTKPMGFANRTDNGQKTLYGIYSGLAP